MSNDEFREGQQEARAHGLKARHETREARAVRKAVAEEIARAIELRQSQFHREGPVYTELEYCVETAREIGSRDPA